MLKNPIKKITVPDITRYDIEREEMHGYVSPWGAVTDETWYRINANPAEEQITVELFDGASFTGDLGTVMNWLEDTCKMQFDCHWESDESPFEPWTPGNTYDAVQYISGLAGNYRVTVLGTPFENLTVSVDDFTRSRTDLADWSDYYDEELDTWVSADEKWRINCFPDEIRVTVDGREYYGGTFDVLDRLEQEEGIVFHQFYWNSDQVYGEPVGDEVHATLECGLARADYTVYVEKRFFEVSAPIPKTVVYNGAEQTLAEAGTTTAGTMYYATGKKEEAPQLSEFTTELPKKKDPGVYYIWYMVEDEEAGELLMPNCAGSAVIKFTDVVKESLWYYGSVYWAVEDGVTSGMGEGTFQPTADLSRAQTVMFLYKLAGQPDVSNLKVADFKDVAKSAWYYNAVKWAVANKITSGYGEGTFQPNVTCNRAMIATFLMRYSKLAGTYTAPTTSARFKDVPANAWYKEAVDWAVASGVTSGYGEGTFQPTVTCNRAMMVTFLKRVAEL